MIMITMINYENGGDSDKSICLLLIPYNIML